jgi:hypothetical protein
MLDELPALQEAVQRYRAAATGAGLVWSAPAALSGGGVSAADVVLAERIFAVDHIPEQVVWLYSQAEPWAGLFPQWGRLLPWPTTSQALDVLSLSIGTPFHWRHQIPVFDFEWLTYTVVLTGPHVGEVWRYELTDTAEGAVRAAPSLAALFHQWADAISAGMVRHRGSDYAGLIFHDELAGHPAEPSADRFRRCEPPLDMPAFPVSVIDEPDLPLWQDECDVDVHGIEDPFEVYEALQDEVAAARRSLGT